MRFILFDGLGRDPWDSAFEQQRMFIFEEANWISKRTTEDSDILEHYLVYGGGLVIFYTTDLFISVFTLTFIVVYLTGWLLCCLFRMNLPL